jgi:ornithine cyclodeaminase
VILRRGPDTLLNRSAWIDGLGLAVKAATIFPDNAARGLPTIGGAVSLMSDADGALEAILDFHLVTKWKTAGDSLLGALKLARPDSRAILIVGAGTVARSLLDAYAAGFPNARFTVWSRTRASAEALAAGQTNVTVAGDLETAVRAADIVACATMATEPRDLRRLAPARHPPRPHRRVPPRHARGRRRGPRPRPRLLRLAPHGR